MAAQASIEEIQLDKLRELLAVLQESNSFQQDKLTRVGSPLASLQAFFSNCPFTTKDELCADQATHPPYGTNLTYPAESYTRFCRTSGTTGQSLTWLDRPEDWLWMLSNWEVVFQEAGCTSKDRAIFPFSFGPFLGFCAAFEAAQNLGMLAIPAGGMGSHQRLQLVVEQQATVLCATPTYAIRLAEAASEQGIDLSQSPIRKILVAGEPGGSIPEIRQKILSLWPSAQVFDHHGMTEVGLVTYQTPDDPDLLHVIESSYIAEVLDPDTQLPLPDGEPGELILTTLGRTGSPLLRYRTGDLVKPIKTSRGLPSRAASSDESTTWSSSGVSTSIPPPLMPPSAKSRGSPNTKSISIPQTAPSRKSASTLSPPLVHLHTLSSKLLKPSAPNSSSASPSKPSPMAHFPDTNSKPADGTKIDFTPLE